MDTALYDLTPAARLALLGVVIAVAPLAWLWLRHRRTTPADRLRALTLLTLFLTFDLVLFGAFTRLTDSGLGCPDWPGCYGSSSPIGARDEIHAAQSAMPTGPVTHGKAWIEMVHRYLAMTVGVLITVLMITSWLLRRRDPAAVVSPWWATATFAWVCVQGAFGALTVTMKLYPAIVTAHLLGGMTGVMLLAAQAQAGAREPVVLTPRLRFAAWGLLALLIAQCALGGWVSANYAVLACTDFPTCQGSWWPPMDFGHAFVLRRELGLARDGGFLPFAALTAIHYVHRLVAYVVLLAMGVVAWRLARSGAAGLRRFALALAGLALWQLASGLSNVVLDWPIVAALAHTGGAAAAVALLTVLLARAGAAGRPEPIAAGAPVLSRRTA
jgi:cytochrome c oxidase assembly protein subunit 15